VLGNKHILLRDWKYHHITMNTDTEKTQQCSTSVVQNARQTERGVFYCKECGKNFVNMARVKRHVTHVHLKKRPFKCNICNKNFGFLCNLKTHEKNIHGQDIKMLPCTLCKKQFKTLGSLQRHTDNVHHKIKNYACLYCKKPFGYQHCLMIHMKCCKKIPQGLVNK